MSDGLHDAVRHLLAGPDMNVGAGEAGGAGLPPGTIGVLRRLLQATQGDPCGPAQTIALAGAALGLAVPDLALSATLSVEVQPIRARFDGAPATAASGLLLPVGTVLTVTGRRALQSASFFTTGAGGQISVAYWT